MPTLIAVMAVIMSFVAGASPVLAEGFIGAMTSGSQRLLSAFALTAAVDTSSTVWLSFQQWIGEGYERAPALMLGLIALLAIPPLALAGFFFRYQRRSPDSTFLISRPSQRSSTRRRATTARSEVCSWPTEAWVDIEGMPGGRFMIGRTLVRIGRESDTDIRLAAKTVHRYHAAIRRTTEGDVVINDLSSSDGNGVLVNGTRVGEARLKMGDVINVGEVRLRFDSRPV